MIYLIHFHRPYCHARHYLGFVDGGERELAARLERHRRGRGARLMEVVTDAGIGWSLAATWPGGRDVERRLKNRHNAPRLCPCCRAAAIAFALPAAPATAPDRPAVRAGVRRDFNCYEVPGVATVAAWPHRPLAHARRLARRIVKDRSILDALAAFAVPGVVVHSDRRAARAA